MNIFRLSTLFVALSLIPVIGSAQGWVNVYDYTTGTYSTLYYHNPSYQQQPPLPALQAHSPSINWLGWAQLYQQRQQQQRHVAPAPVSAHWKAAPRIKSVPLWKEAGN